ncbi:phosphoglucomutase/phosphomannomutase family protein, partial [Candidatus Omnitrophota bacterium]
KVIRIQDYDGVKLVLDDQSWLMFRGSGTEPIMRIYSESASLDFAQKLLDFGKDLILKGGL